ncbi:MAG TPA: hypothetical protein VJ021_09765 [Thermoplasmata archaeon]|nr:hypothetical protein [Thermoplasmata archaeon]
MSANLRISLTILSVGFAVEGAGEVYSLATAGSFLPGTSLLFLLPAVVTLLGLLFLLIGRHEWDELHRARVRRANLIFGLSLLAGFVAVIEVVLLVAYPGVGAPLWAEVVFGAAAGAFLLGTFVTYAQFVFHLVTRPSKVALVASSLWALLVSAFVAQTLAVDLPSILGTIGAHSFSIGYLISPVDYLASFLFISYFLLLAAYVDAHITVARRRATWLGKATKATNGVEALRISARPLAVVSVSPAPAPVEPPVASGSGESPKISAEDPSELPSLPDGGSDSA